MFRLDRILLCLHTGVLLTILSAQTTKSDVLVRSLELYRRGNCKEAKPLFEQILRTQPKNTAVRKLLANCLDREDRVQEAREERKRVLAVSPGDAQAAQKLAPPPVVKKEPAVVAPKLSLEQVERQAAGAEFDAAEHLILAKKYNQAEEALLRIVARKPELTLPRIRLAELYSATKEHEKAADLYRGLVEQSGSNPALELRMAQNLMWAERYEEAATAYAKYLGSKPEDHDSRLAMANALMWSEDYPKAAAAYTEYLRENPENYDARLNLANSLLWSEHFPETRQHLLALRERRARDAKVEVALASLDEQTGQSERALATYEAVLTWDPQNESAVEGRARLLSEVPLKKAYASMEAKDYETSAKFFRAYLDRNPGKDEIVLQVARVNAWGKFYDEAKKYYNDYLDRQPEEAAALRELAKLELSIPDYPNARKHYAMLVNLSDSTVEDYEGMINSHLWDNQLEAAQPYARKLLERYFDSEIGNSAVQAFQENKRQTLLESARKLTADGRYEEALEAYRGYTAIYGMDPHLELTVSRLYSWSKQEGKAAIGYQEYLQRNPNDAIARLELADLAKYSKQFDSAAAQYKQVLDKEPNNSRALLGLAQISDYKGEDRFTVIKAYRQVLNLDPRNTMARDKVDEIGPQVSPSVGYTQRGFKDSDGFGRSINTFEASIPIRGGLRLTPFYSYGYFNQPRQIGGGECGVAPTETDPKILSLSQQLCDKRGTMTSNAVGLRFSVAPTSLVTFNGEASAVRYDNGRSNLNGSAEILLHPDNKRTISATFYRRDVVFDVNTVASLLAGVRGDTFLLGYQQLLSDKWNFSVQGGLTKYSGGADKDLPTNTQKRIYARLDYKVTPELSAGYFMRVTGFDNASRVYFSPDLYGTYGFTYAYRKQFSKSTQLTLDGDLGYGRLTRYDFPRVNVVEVFLYPALQWFVKPDLALGFGYRYGRGRNSAFGSPVYSTGAFEFSLHNYFMPRTTRLDPTRVELK